MKKIWDKNIFMISFVLWSILHVTGISDFYYQMGYHYSFHVYVYKIIHLVFLYFLIYNIVHLFRNRKRSIGKNKWRMFLIYFAICIVFFLIFFPGIWSYDDVDILNGAYRLDLVPWQHFFSGLFYNMCLQTIPIPSSIILIQLLIISMIMSRVITSIVSLYGKKESIILKIGLIIISFFPPVILYMFSGFRMGMYSFLELFLVIDLLYLYLKNKKIDIISLIELCFLLYVVATWRTEAIYYFPVLIIFLPFFYKKIIKVKTLLISLGIVFVLSLCTMKFNNMLIGNNKYSLTATIDHASDLVKYAKEDDQEEVDAINRVLNVDYILANPNENGETYFWGGNGVRDYSDEDYKAYMSAYIKLTLKYPKVVLNSMWDIFYRACSGQGKDGHQTSYNMLMGTLFIFDKEKIHKEFTDEAYGYIVPISEKLRNKSILFFGGINEEKEINIIHRIFWNIFIPLVLLIVMAIIKLFKKEWFKALLCAIILVRVPLLFVTSPAPYFMYYLAIYLCGYVLAFLFIYDYVINKKNFLNRLKEKKIYKFISFFIVSGIGWCIDFSVYLIITSVFGLKVLFANIISAIPAITYVFLMSSKKIFKNKNSKYSIKTKYLIYFGYQIILLLVVSGIGQLLYNYLINVITNTFILEHLKIFIKIIITPITMTLNYIVMKNLIEKL